jgi:hypothetical protein
MLDLGRATGLLVQWCNWVSQGTVRLDQGRQAARCHMRALCTGWPARQGTPYRLLIPEPYRVSRSMPSWSGRVRARGWLQIL